MKNIFSKRLISLLLIIPFLTTTMPIISQGSPVLAQEEIESRAADKRALVLQAYLAKHNSPMQYQAQNFVDAADQYNLDWKLVPAIAGVESTFGKFIPGGYNAWGWGVYGTQAIYFGSWKDGIFTVSEGLRKNYLNKGLSDPYDINRVYAASPTWGSHVSYFLGDLERFEKNYRMEDSKQITDITANIAGQSGLITMNQPKTNQLNLISLDK